MKGLSAPFESTKSSVIQLKTLIMRENVRDKQKVIFNLSATSSTIHDVSRR